MVGNAFRFLHHDIIEVALGSKWTIKEEEKEKEKERGRIKGDQRSGSD
jgi:hypothetical protein